ncbi:hypothetical protein R3P38DRAFT_3195455 [Favolaschia claudopus]|uniref:Uncharacterized protein n=1 Tax=Favolaschia claudopus TaxID=2862362 RepID=A0AAW0BAV3_9AGAR
MPTTRNSIASPDHIACVRNTRFHRPSDYRTVGPRPAALPQPPPSHFPPRILPFDCIVFLLFGASQPS